MRNCDDYYCGQFHALVQSFEKVAEQQEMMECDPPTGEEGGAKQRRSAQKLIERWGVYPQTEGLCDWGSYLIFTLCFVRYYYQLTTGCGQSCGNPHCASNSTPVAPNEAAAKALHLFKVFHFLTLSISTEFTLTLTDSRPPMSEAGG